MCRWADVESDGAAGWYHGIPSIPASAMFAQNPIQRIARFFLLPLSSVSNRLGNRFYVGLAVVATLAAVFAIPAGMTAGMKSHAYDLIMKYRFRAPVADPGIVVIDIDEPALAAMAPEYGRWPWPRNVMGEMVEGIAAQGPKAIVFDITFADPDVFNADGDKYFRDVIARIPLTFFPMIRLDEEADAQSGLRLARLPGASRLGDDAVANATLAAVVPFFYDVLDGVRLGTSNLDTDADGIVRSYAVFTEAYGWRIGSLPANVVAATGGALPDDASILLNWRGRPPSYAHVPFHEVYLDFLRSKHTRAPDEFAGKIVIVGSTASALFDATATPVSKLHPGVEILATALDNLKNGDSLSELSPWVYVLITATALSLLTFAFVYNVDQRVVNLAFTLVQSGFLAVSYLALNFSTVFVDLTAPIAFSLAYFTVARFNSMFAAFRRNGHPLFSTLLDEGRACRAILVQCRVHIRERNARLALGARIKKQAGLARFGVVTPPLFKGLPLIDAFFRDSIVFYWLVPREDESAARADALAVLARAVPAIERAARRHAPKGGPLVTWFLHSFEFTVDAGDAWRDRGADGVSRLFALAAGAGGGGEGLIRLVATGEFQRFSGSSELPEPLRGLGL
jgi:adenylate cyclase